MSTPIIAGCRRLWGGALAAIQRWTAEGPPFPTPNPLREDRLSAATDSGHLACTLTTHKCIRRHREKQSVVDHPEKHLSSSDMARLNFNAYAYDLESAVRIIRGGLDAAERALQEDEDRVTADMNDNNRKIEDDEVRGGEVSSDGELDYDPNEIYAYDFMTIESTQMEVRKSMMIALYHAWERVARNMTRKTGSKDNHATLEAAMADEGITLVPELDQLRRLVNLVKHNSKEKMLHLWNVRKDLFYGGFDPEVHFPDDWSDTVRLDRDQIEGFYAAVLASGPSHVPKA
jgi:hypothetical protein